MLANEKLYSSSMAKPELASTLYSLSLFECHDVGQWKALSFEYRCLAASWGVHDLASID